MSLEPPLNHEPDNWERKLLKDVLESGISEQRRSRRWGIFFKVLTFIYLTIIILSIFGLSSSENIPLGARDEHVALISIEGSITSDGKNSAVYVTQSLKKAFEAQMTQGVILKINSPGGSPVQSSLIYDEVKKLRMDYPQKPLYVVVEDICASGGYFIASAAEKIFVNPSSLIGSIGVLMNSFGFTKAMEKLGIERRLLTAGENKGFLDPFSPETPEELTHAKNMLTEIHQQFIAAVKEGRKGKLSQSKDLFTGLIWTGETGIELGLADGYGSVNSVSRDIFNTDNLISYNTKPSFSELISKNFGAKVKNQIKSLFPIWQ